MNEKYIQLLTRQLDEVENIGNNPATNKEYSFGVEAWKSSTISVIERIYGRKSRKIEEIEKIKLGRSQNIDGPPSFHVETVKERARAIIQACIAELESLGSPEQIYHGEGSGVNLTVQQSQENMQTIKVDVIINELRKELTGNQLNEIQQILNSEEKTDQKKKKTFEKLKQFGEDTLAKVISGILTNPGIMGG